MAAELEGPLIEHHVPLGGERPLLPKIPNVVADARFQWEEKKSKYTRWDWVLYFCPFLDLYLQYREKWREWLPWDLLAGITVGVMVIPQGLSYGSLAGLPSIYGLYGAFVPNLIYGLFGNSRQLAVGPVAVTSLLLASSLNTNMFPHNPNTNANSPKNPALQMEYNHAAIQIALIAGLLYTAVGVFRLGWIVNFLSRPVISGFSTGAAIIIALTQIQYIVGVKMPRADKVQDAFRYLGDYLPHTRWQDTLLGLSFMFIIILFRYLGGKYKRLYLLKSLGPVTITVFGIIMVYAGKLYLPKANPQLKTLGTIPKGLPHATTSWWFPMQNPSKQFSIAVLICLVDLCESLAMAKVMALKNKYELKPVPELVGLGLANLAGAMFNCYTTTGSFSRTAVNHSVGAKSRLSCIIAAIVVMFALLFMTPAFAYMPQGVQGAVVITGVSSLFHFNEAWYLFKVSKIEFLVWCAAWLATMFGGVEIGIATSMGLSLAIVLWRAAFPVIVVLGRLKNSTLYRNIKQYPDTLQDSSVLIIRVNAPMFFANVENIKYFIINHVRKALEQNVTVSNVIMDFGPVNDIDVTAEDGIRTLVEELKNLGATFLVANPSDEAVIFLKSTGLLELLGSSSINISIHNAYLEAKRRQQQIKDEQEAGARSSGSGDEEAGSQPGVELTQRLKNKSKDDGKTGAGGSRRNSSRPSKNKPSRSKGNDTSKTKEADEGGYQAPDQLGAGGGNHTHGLSSPASELPSITTLQDPSDDNQAARQILLNGEEDSRVNESEEGSRLVNGDDRDAVKSTVVAIVGVDESV